MTTYTVQRLQNNAAWSAEFTFANTDLTGWVMVGRAQSMKNSAKYVDISTANGQIEVSNAEAGTFSITLSTAETANLTVGQVVFEVMRTSPAPKRPVLRFTITNHEGIAE